MDRPTDDIPVDGRRFSQFSTLACSPIFRAEISRRWFSTMGTTTPIPWRMRYLSRDKTNTRFDRARWEFVPVNWLVKAKQKKGEKRRGEFDWWIVITLNFHLLLYIYNDEVLEEFLSISFRSTWNKNEGSRLCARIFYYREKSNRAFGDTLAWPNMIYPRGIDPPLPHLRGKWGHPVAGNCFAFLLLTVPLLYRPVYTSFIRNNAREPIPFKYACENKTETRYTNKGIVATIRKVKGRNSRERGDDCGETRAEEVGEKRKKKKKKRKVHRQKVRSWQNFNPERTFIDYWRARNLATTKEERMKRNTFSHLQIV